MAEQRAAEESQEKLLARIGAGDTQALADFYDLTANPLFSLAVRILGDRNEAEEVIQDVFVQIWNKASAFDPLLGSAFQWAMGIARHRSIDRLRARQRRTRLIEEVANEASDGVTSKHANLEEPDAAEVKSALSQLPSEQRRVLEMAFFSGLTHPEIAEALREPLGTVKARIRRGLLKLRDTLATLK
jgi:RNA polymerase sigma-70 factor (ECF subfamily)